MTDPRQYQATTVAVTTPDSTVTHEADWMNVNLETGSLLVTVGDTPVAVYAPGQWCSAVRS